MARMIPPTIRSSVRSRAERQVFHILREAPGSEEWVCLHSLGLAKHEAKRRGEIDFLLITDKAVLVFEVKGGGVARHDGSWTTTDRFGEVHRLAESPFDQASGAMFSLDADLREEFPDTRLSRLLLGYGVIFPDVEFEATGCEGDRALVYDARDRRRPVTDYIARLTTFTRSAQSAPRYAPRRPDRDALVDYLRGDFDLLPALSRRTEDAVSRLLELTREQYLVLDVLRDRPRVVVEGGAGTGKTLLAAEVARQEATVGRRVLLLCFNRLLACHLRETLRREEFPGHLEVDSLHRLMDRLIRRTPLTEEFESRKASLDGDELFWSLYPEYALVATDEKGFLPYDSLVVDEAQDMMSGATLDFLDACLAGGLEAGRWRAFFDSNNQAALFGRFEAESYMRLLAFGQSHLLTTNCRNTVQVTRETEIVTGPSLCSVGRVDGEPVEYRWFRNPEDQRQQLQALFRDLLRKGVRPSDITLLTAKKLVNSCGSGLRGVPLTTLTDASIENVADTCYEHRDPCNGFLLQGVGE